MAKRPVVKLIRLRYPAGLLTAAWLFAACGAPLQHASDVSGLFSAPPPPLGTLANAICQAMAQRSTPPTVSQFADGTRLKDCSDAGSQAANYSQIDAFQFANVATTGATDPTIYQKTLRTQIYLNKELLDLLPLVTSMISKNGGSMQPGVINLPDSALKAIGGLVKPTITLTQVPIINLDDLSFSLKLHISVTGAVAVDTDVTLTGKVFAQGIGVIIATDQPDQPYDKSFVKSFQAQLLVVPYAQDVYMDMYVHVNIYDIGLDGLIDGKISSLFGTGLKKAIDSIVQVAS